MLQIVFLRPLAAREIQNPAIETLRRFSDQRDTKVQVYVLRQEAYEVIPRQYARRRRRIGIHDHLEYSFGIGEREQLGRIMLLSDLKFGGFHRNAIQTYGTINLAKPSEIGRFGLIDPSDELMENVHGMLTEEFNP